jgi:hypothetical protein
MLTGLYLAGHHAARMVGSLRRHSRLLVPCGFLAWHTNRDWWKRDGGEKDLLRRFRMIATGLLTAERYDYAKRSTLEKRV